METTLEVIQGRPVELGDITYVEGKQPAFNSKEDVLVKIKITGRRLENSEIVVPSASKGKLVAENDAKTKDGELTQQLES